MDISTLRNSMECLWKETFGDSDAYIKLIFENYFSPDNIAVYEYNGAIGAAILGIPYEFSAKGVSLKGLYLCGISTLKNLRGRGIMTTLLNEINNKAKKEDYDFSFLIPSSESNRNFYKERGYHDSFFKLRNHFVRIHNFKENITLSVKPYDRLKEEETLKFLFSSQGGKNEAFNLIHTLKDWQLILKEAEISEEPVYIAEKNERVVGVAFCKKTKEEDGYDVIEVKEIVSDEKDVILSLLHKIKTDYPDSGIDLIRNIERDGLGNRDEQIWSPFFARNNAPEAEYEDISEQERPVERALNAYSYGMVRIFDIRGLLHKIHTEENNNSIAGYSDEELIKIVLRHPMVEGKKDELEKLLDLPRLSLNMSLMLD